MHSSKSEIISSDDVSAHYSNDTTCHHLSLQVFSLILLSLCDVKCANHPPAPHQTAASKAAAAAALTHTNESARCALSALHDSLRRRPAFRANWTANHKGETSLARVVSGPRPYVRAPANRGPLLIHGGAGPARAPPVPTENYFNSQYDIAAGERETSFLRHQAVCHDLGVDSESSNERTVRKKHEESSSTFQADASHRLSESSPFDPTRFFIHGSNCSPQALQLVCY
ncbi:hypothetical protein CDAR_580641 [Caerostris darwini]|uniref:Uncharacterized protein n=1 Tax=Caerostris darwini TaxID=1538125 RepID=A0AAV4R7S0_9ARAC|nr:hypothetical protein CDAR_580641 [Caerostris darwini]